jgi:2-polyprenyl-3-methyl-5-hydroxy-6-metoxy-1,4-benzoquinol methylase
MINRQRTPELMDQPGLDPSEHAAALRGLKRIHKISLSERYFIRALETVGKNHSGKPLRVLDMACGGGDLLCSLVKKARSKGWNMVAEGCDFSDQAVQIATENARNHGVSARFFQWDALQGPLPEKYDVIVNSLFLHHLDESQVVTVLKNMADSVNHMIVVDDLIRSRWGYVMAKVGCHMLSRSPIVHFDGPVSVKAAFSLAEISDLARQAGLSGVQIQKHWPERFILTWQAS